MEISEVCIVTYGIDQDAVSATFGELGCLVIDHQDALNVGFKFPVLVSNHPIDWSRGGLVKRLGEINVRFMYAGGKLAWNLSEWNALYDLILCFGPFYQKLFEMRFDIPVIQMGYPRFDDYFLRQGCFESSVQEGGGRPEKKTVLWLPTWKGLSSIGHFEDEIAALSSRFRVIVKVHPLMVDDEPRKVSRLKHLPFSRVITDCSDYMPLMEMADYVVADYGGPSLAAIYLNKNVILLDVPGAKDDQLMCAESPEFILREKLGSIVVGEADWDAMLSDEILWHGQMFLRRELGHQFFAPYYGFASKMAAQAILNADLVVRNSL